MTQRATHRLAVVAAIAALVLTACGNTTASRPIKGPDRWPAVLSDFTFVWSAEPGIDLLTQPIVTLRAYFESLVLAGAAGSNDYLYPGFDHAVQRETPVDYSHYSLNLWPELGFPDKAPVVGSSFLHVLRVTREGSNVTIVMCTWDWAVAAKRPDGLYTAPESQRAPTADIGVQNVRLTTPAPSPSDTTPNMGPSRFPLTDVFGNWRVVGRLSQSSPSDTLGPGTQWPEYHQDLDACQALAPEPLERRQFLTTGEHPRSDFPTLPSAPGWPLETQ